MAEIIAIICEYNPFHSGHKFQIDSIKKSHPDAKIIAIMSGNCTQRGELAMMNKYSRAESAVACGVDVVFELPYPYSSSNAEVFANAGAYIASSVGATHLCFGSENGDLEYLSEIANTLDSDEYEEAVSLILKDKSISYPKAREKALLKMDKKLPSAPNDMLGVEYIRAIKKINSSIIPVVIKRNGQGYKEYEISDIMSAGAIRKFFYEKGKFVSVPSLSLEIYKREELNGQILNKSFAKDLIHKMILLSSPNDFDGLYDIAPGMGNFIVSTAEESKDGEEFFEKLTSKSYTRARLTRVVMYKIFGINSIDSYPYYTAVLASSRAGRTLLKELKKSSQIDILTKTGDYKKMSERAIKQFEVASKLDKLFLTLMKRPLPSINSYKYSPFIQK